MMTELERLCRKYGITAESVAGAAEPWPDEWQGRECHAWTVTLSWYGPEGKRHSRQKPLTITVSFFQGVAHENKPTPADVLSSSLVDASVEDYGTFEEWCAELGYKTDSRKAARTYRECMKKAPRVRAFCCNDDAVLNELRDAEH